MQITYIGAHDEVIVPALGLRVKNGETVEAPDDIAAGLLAQGSYPEHEGADGETVPAGEGTEWELADKPKAGRANPSPTRPGAGLAARGTLDAPQGAAQATPSPAQTDDAA